MHQTSLLIYTGKLKWCKTLFMWERGLDNRTEWEKKPQCDEGSLVGGGEAKAGCFWWEFLRMTIAHKQNNNVWEKNNVWLLERPKRQDHYYNPVRVTIRLNIETENWKEDCKRVAYSLSIFEGLTGEIKSWEFQAKLHCLILHVAGILELWLPWGGAEVCVRTTRTMGRCGQRYLGHV